MFVLVGDVVTVVLFGAVWLVCWSGPFLLHSYWLRTVDRSVDPHVPWRPLVVCHLVVAGLASVWLFVAPPVFLMVWVVWFLFWSARLGAALLRGARREVRGRRSQRLIDAELARVARLVNGG